MIFVDKKFFLSIFAIPTIFLLSISPLYSKIPDKPHGDLPSQYWQFWFLYESHSRPGQDYRFYRPFYSDFKEHETGYRQRTILFPIFYKEQTNYWHTWTILFYFTGIGFTHEDTGDDEDILTPLFFWGKGKGDRDNYWGVFPFYGKMNAKLGLDEVGFVLFPLYSHWKRKDYNAEGILWPLIMWGKSETRDDLRIFPFYSKKEHNGKYYQYSFLWPFIQWGRKYMDKREPVSYRLIFPFYLNKDSDYGNMKSHAIFWFPFLGSLFGYGYDNVTSEVDFNILFFVFQFSKNNNMDYRKFIFFPFYGQNHFASRKTTFITPFYFNLQSDTLHVKSDMYFLLPFFIHSHSKYHELNREETYWKVWPFIKYHKDTEGSAEWNVFTLLPLPSEELDRTWDPIISILEYKDLSNGEKQLSLFFRLYTQRWSEERFALYIPLLADYESSKISRKWEILYGLFEYESQDEKQNYQFLWFLKI